MDSPVVDLVSCPLTTFYAAVDGGDAEMYQGATWSAPDPIAAAEYQEGSEVPPDLRVLSCPTASFCLALDGFDNGLNRVMVSARMTLSI
jgi:hypothetical protein